MSGKLDDLVIVVTGAAGGIGEGCTRALLDEGARVAMWDLDIDRMQPVIERLGTPDRTAAFAVDVTDEAAVDDAVGDVVTHFGRLDGIVNNAGVITMSPAWDLTARHWSSHLDVNVVGSFLCAKAVGAHLRRSGGGSIVNVASNCGKAGYPNMAAYNASKSAVIGLTRSLSMEWADVDINVNAVCPGGVDTPMLAQVADWLAPRVGSPADELLAGMQVEQLGRRIEPVEVGRVIAFLLSPDATIIRGQSISVDGGDTPY